MFSTVISPLRFFSLFLSLLPSFLPSYLPSFSFLRTRRVRRASIRPAIKRYGDTSRCSLLIFALPRRRSFYVPYTPAVTRYASSPFRLPPPPPHGAGFPSVSSPTSDAIRISSVTRGALLPPIKTRPARHDGRLSRPSGSHVSRRRSPDVRKVRLSCG